jgi:hypothetical protein
MKLSQQYNHDPRHFQFQRGGNTSPCWMEVYEPGSKFRWALAVAIAAISLLILVLR